MGGECVHDAVRLAEHCGGLARVEALGVLAPTNYETGRSNDAGRYDVLCSTDEALLSALALGVRGAVGSMCNFAAPLFLAIMEAHQRGDLVAARRLQARSIELVEAVAATGYMSTARLPMGRVGSPSCQLSEQGPGRTSGDQVGGAPHRHLAVDACRAGTAARPPGSTCSESCDRPDP